MGNLKYYNVTKIMLEKTKVSLNKIIYFSLFWELFICVSSGWLIDINYLVRVDFLSESYQMLLHFWNSSYEQLIGLECPSTKARSFGILRIQWCIDIIDKNAGASTGTGKSLTRDRGLMPSGLYPHSLN